MANSKIEKKISGSEDDIKTGSLKIGSSTYNNGTISLSPSTNTMGNGGIIDFHYNQSTNYTCRFIEGGTYLSIYGKKLALQAGPLEIAYGGTSATTAAGARTQLGIDTLYYTKTETDTKLSEKMAATPANIEMYPSSDAGYGGFIDFHYNGNTTADYTARIIERENFLEVFGKPFSMRTGVNGSTLSTRTGFQMVDSENVMIGSLQAIWSGSSTNRGLQLTTLRNNIANTLVLAVNSNNERKVVVTEPAAWRDGLGITGGYSMTGTLTIKDYDVHFISTSTSEDAGDLVWYYKNGTEKMRIYAPNTPSARQGPCFKLFNSAGTALTSQNIALAVVDNFTFTPRDSTVANVGGLGCKCFSDRVYIMDLSLNISKAASTAGQYYKLGTISSGYSPSTNIYTLSHNFSAPFKEIRLTSGGELGIDHAAAISTTTNVRFTLVWVR